VEGRGASARPERENIAPNRPPTWRAGVELYVVQRIRRATANLRAGPGALCYQAERNQHAQARERGPHDRRSTPSEQRFDAKIIALLYLRDTSTTHRPPSPSTWSPAAPRKRPPSLPGPALPPGRRPCSTQAVPARSGLAGAVCSAWRARVWYRLLNSSKCPTGQERSSEMSLPANTWREGPKPSASDSSFDRREGGRVAIRPQA
jgi:hypothetical protein